MRSIFSARRALAFCLLLGCSAGADLRCFASVLTWGPAGSNAGANVLDATIIPTTGQVTYAGVDSGLYDLKVTTANLLVDGFDDNPTAVLPTKGWWFEGTGPSSSAHPTYATVTFRFYQPSTTTPIGLSGIFFYLEDAETNERFRNFGYYDPSGTLVPTTIGGAFLSSSATPIMHLTDGSFESGNSFQGGTQAGKWIKLDVSGMPVSGFTFQAHRQTSGAGSVIMSAIDPFALDANIGAKTLDLGGSAQSLTAVTIAGGVIKNGTLTATGYTSTGGTASAVLAGAGAALTHNSGTLTLSGANTYTGTTTIAGGTLEVVGGAALSDAGAVVIADVAGAVLLVSASETIGSLNGGGTTGGEVALGAGTLTVGDASAQSYHGAITGTGGTLVKQGSGSLALDGPLAFGTLVTTAGVTNLNSAFTSGTLDANATTNITVSQDLLALNIGTVAVAPLAGLGDGGSATPTGVVPEPGLMSLLLAGTLGLLARRRSAQA